MTPEEKPCWCIGCHYWDECNGVAGDTTALFGVCSRWSPDRETLSRIEERMWKHDEMDL
jgi:hypothetical protein